jgi:hypothetical protein
MLSSTNRVHFSHIVPSSCSPPALSPDCENSKNGELWYQPSEIQHFRKNASHLVFLGKSFDGNEDGDCDISGFQRYTLERTSNKSLAIECVLLASRQALGADLVAAIAGKCSAHARDLAAIQGINDYCMAYPLPFVRCKRDREESGTIMSRKTRAVTKLRDDVVAIA